MSIHTREESPKQAMGELLGGLTFGFMTGESAMELDRSVRLPLDMATRLEAVSEI
jgi:hypothetical protein